MTAAVVVLLVIAGVIALGPLFVRIDPLATDPQNQLQPPDMAHLLGTDLLGRDVLSRVIHGGRTTLMIAALGTLLAISGGLPLGWIAGTGGHIVDRIVVIAINTLLSIPGLVASLVVLTLMGRGIWPLVVALGISQIAPFAFVTRSAIRFVRSSDYIMASIGMGASRFQIFRFHILPNIQPTLLAYTGVVFGYVLLNGAALNFLGLGSAPGVPEWGVMLAEGRAAFRSAPWIGLAPGVAITLTIWAVNRITDEIAARPSWR